MSAAARVERLGEGRLRLAGRLDFETVPALWPECAALVEAGAAEVVDLSGVTAADSAGLALLVEWVRAARAAGRDVRFHGLPAAMAALAGVSGLERVLPLEDGPAPREA